MLELFGLVALGLAWLVPNHYPPWSSFYNDSCAALGLAFLAAGLWRRLADCRAPLPAWTLVAIAAIPWIQYRLGWLSFSGDALISSLYLLGFASAIWVGKAWASADPGSAASRLAWATLAAALASSVLALLQSLQIAGLGIWSMDPMPAMHAYANLAQPNNLGTLLGLGVVSLMLLFEHQRLSTWSSALMLAALVVAGASTQSRTALLFGPLILAIMSLALNRGVVLATRRSVVAIATAAHWTLTWSWPWLQIQLGLASPPSLAERGIETPRADVWRILLDALSGSPWHGFGWLQTGAAELAAADRHAPVEELWLQSHNLFIDLLVWCGYPLGLTLCGLLIIWFIDRVWHLNTVEALAGMLSVTVLGAHAMLELPHHYAYFLIPVGLWIGQVECAERTSTPLSARWSLAPAALALLLLGAVWRDYPAVEEDYRLVRFEGFKIGSVHADKLSPDAPFLSSLTAFLRFARTSAVAGMTAEQLEDMRLIVERYPYASSLARYARALALNGRVDEAERVFRKIHYIHEKRLYSNLLQDLRERTVEGETGLAPLLQRLTH